MGSWDYSKAAAIITTSDTPILDAMASQYGVPICLLNMGKSILRALPSSVLGGMSGSIGEGKRLADSIMKDIMRRIFLDSGIVEYDTNSGKFVFVSSSSNLGVEQNMLQDINNLFGLGTILGFGAQALMIGKAGAAFAKNIKDCIDKMKSFNALQQGPSANADKLAGFGSYPAPPKASEAASQAFDENKEMLKSTVNFTGLCTSSLNEIAEVIQERQEDPSLEPVYASNAKNKDGETLSEVLEKANIALSSLTLNIVDPDDPNSPYYGWRQDENGNWHPPIDEGEKPDSFADHLTPYSTQAPIAKKGKFVYSRTGIYYDSYRGGVPYDGCQTNIVSAVYYDDNGKAIPGAGIPPNIVKWMHKYNPNLGGKGTCLSWNTFNKWSETIFDLSSIAEDPATKKFYDADHFLQVLIDQRNREIYDLSSNITDFIANGYAEDSFSVKNQRQSLYSTIADHDSKINRRKKQIEVHIRLAPKGKAAVPGKIPINDFKSINIGKVVVPQSKQEALLFHQYEVSGLVLPLCPTFVENQVTERGFSVHDLMVPTVGVGSIISSDPYASGTSGTILSLDDRISTSGLAAIYNFLDADLVPPDSTEYYTINCATSSTTDKAAQIVASSIDSMFPSGIGIPYFRGVCNFFSGVSGDGNSKAAYYTDNNRYLHSGYRPYGYAKLMPGKNTAEWELEDLFYTSAGATMETWLHVPDLLDAQGPGWNADSSLSSLHRVILGCENRGGTYTTTDPDLVVGPRYGSDVVRGLLMGFTRDRRFTLSAAPSNDPAQNNIDNGLVFYMAPTQSVNTDSVTFLTPSADVAYCAQDQTAPSGPYGLTLDTSTVVSGVKLDSTTSSFMLLSVAVDYKSNAIAEGQGTVNVYLNGNLMKSVTARSVFGKNPKNKQQDAPDLPSTTDASSFKYDKQYSYGSRKLPVKGGTPPNTNSLGYLDFWRWDAPVPHGNATPWIIGGGYTDGMHPDWLVYKGWKTYSGDSIEGMNFLGGKWGGKKSGLYGYLGSFKLYKRAISQAEALQNYDAQKGFFENIRL